MAIRVKCPKCSRILNAPDEKAGQQVKCPGCGQVLRLPARPAAPPAATAPPPAPARPAGPPPRPARPAPVAQAEEPAEGGPAAGAREAWPLAGSRHPPDPKAEERRKRRQEEYERKKRRAALHKGIAFPGMLLGAGGAALYLFDVVKGTGGVAAIAGGVALLAISIILLMLTPKVGAPPSERR